MESTQYYEYIQLQHGDTKAFEALYKMRYADMCRWAMQIVKDRERAEELVDDVFLTLWNNRKQLPEIGHIDAYLYASVRNSCINEIKSKHNRQQAQTLSADTDLDYNVLAEAFSSENAGYELLAAEDLQQKIARAIDEMPEKMREVFMMCRQEGVPVKEIAERQQISIDTVRYHIKTALQRLRSALLKDN